MNKYRNKKVEYDGIVFDSKKEKEHYVVLKQREKNGEIHNLKRQVRFELVPNQYIEGKLSERKITYIADFVYEKDGKKVVEDVKGCKFGAAYNMFKVKRKLMLYMCGIKVIEI